MKTSMSFVCIYCENSKFHSYPELQEHHKVCKASAKMSDMAHALVPALMMSLGCDHYCCGLSDTSCAAESVASYIKDERIDNDTLFNALAKIPGIREAVLNHENKPNLPVEILS